MASAVQKTIKTGLMKVNDAEIYYEIHGDGDLPLILIHGIGGNLNTFKAQIDYFSDKHKVIAYDVRGHGKSSKPRGDYSFQVFSDDLYAFMQGLKINKAIVVGHSMGGGIAATFAIDHPEMVSTLILLSTSTKGDKKAYYQSWPFTHLMFKATMKMLVDQQSDESTTKEEKEAFINSALNTSKYVFNQCLKGISNYDIRDRLAQIKSPTLIITGDKDTMTPSTESHILNEGIKGSKLLVIPNAKHLIIILNAKEVNETIAEFIK